MKPASIPLSIGLFLSLVSCGPVRTVSRYGMKARLIDASTKQPLERVETRIMIDGREFRRTSSRKGLVIVSPDLEWHLSWLGGPAYWSRSGAEIGFEAEGYPEKSFKWERYLPSVGSPFTEENGVVDLGTVELEKR